MIEGGRRWEGVGMKESLSGLTEWQLLKWASVSGRWRGGPWGSVTDGRDNLSEKAPPKKFLYGIINSWKYLLFFFFLALCALLGMCHCRIKPSSLRWSYGARCTGRSRYLEGQGTLPFLCALPASNGGPPKRSTPWPWRWPWMFAKDGEGDKEGGDRKVMMAGDGGEERILEIAPPPPTRGTWGALRGGRKWLVAEIEWERQREREREQLKRKRSGGMENIRPCP